MRVFFGESDNFFLYILGEDPLHIDVVLQCTGSIIGYQ